jgi:hypothetical protein
MLNFVFRQVEANTDSFICSLTEFLTLLQAMLGERGYKMGFGFLPLQSDRMV